MAKISEETFNNWRKPPSDSEESKLNNAQKMIFDAINSDDNLKNMSINIFGQGSYANDTNIRLDSDIDINVCLKDVFYNQLPKGKKDSDFSIVTSDYSFSEFKTSVTTALINKFGASSVVRKDKCITIVGNSYRVGADVVPTFEFRRYNDTGQYISGTKFISDSNSSIINYPLQHIDNGKEKNANTSKRFKRLVRIFKKIRNHMNDNGSLVSSNITSFLLECLVWNVPNSVFNDYNNWTERIKQAIISLSSSTATEETCKEWGEVSELLYLFHGVRKWSVSEVNAYLQGMWNYLEFKNE